MKLKIPDNPIVVRAFRIGFRSGPGSFRIATWGTILAGIFIFSALHYTVFPRDLDPDGHATRVARTLLALLLFFTAATFVIGGLQRMLVSFSRERERGTFDFLHLSTLRPSAVIWGFLLGGQLPGYLLLGLTLPVLHVVAFIAKFNPGILLLLVLALAGYAVFLSLLFLLVGFWMKKAADLRGSAAMGAGVIMLVATFVSSDSDRFQAVAIIGGYPVLLSLWNRGMGVTVLDLPFFSWTLPISVAATIVLFPIGCLIFRCLRRSFRYRERKSISDLGILFLVSWLHVVFTGLFWGSGMPVEQRLDVGYKLVFLSLGSWILFAWLFNRSLRPAAAVVRRLYRLSGNRRALLLDPDGPPYRLIGFLSLELVVAGGAQILGTTDIPGGVSRDLVLSIFLVPIFLPFAFLLGQYLEWTTPGRSGKVIVTLLHVGILWIPFSLHLVLPQFSLHVGEAWEGVLRAMSAVSPFTQLHAFVGLSDGSPRTLDIVVTAVSGMVYLSAAAGMVVLHARALAKLQAGIPNRGVAAPGEKGSASAVTA